MRVWLCCGCEDADRSLRCLYYPVLPYSILSSHDGLRLDPGRNRLERAFFLSFSLSFVLAFGEGYVSRSSALGRGCRIVFHSFVHPLLSTISLSKTLNAPKPIANKQRPLHPIPSSLPPKQPLLPLISQPLRPLVIIHHRPLPLAVVASRGIDIRLGWPEHVRGAAAADVRAARALAAGLAVAR